MCNRGIRLHSFMGSWLVKLLLHRGYTVVATVRDLSDPVKTKHLMALEGAKERLHLMKADLMEEGSFDGAVAGCEGAFHAASPVIFNPKDLQAATVLQMTRVEVKHTPRMANKLAYAMAKQIRKDCNASFDVISIDQPVAESLSLYYEDKPP